MSSETIKDIGTENIDNFVKDGYKTLMEAIKHSNNLPQGSNWNFYNTHYGFVKIINYEADIVLKQINTLLKTNQVDTNIHIRGLEEKTELIVEGNDNILERVANNIDEINGIRKSGNAPIVMQTVCAELPINGSWNRVNSAMFSVSPVVPQNNSKNGANVIKLLTAKNIIRPQKMFKDKIINSSSMPWEPRIKEKPNSIKPLAIFLEETENGEEYSHPYEVELDKFEPLDEQLKKETPVKPLPLAKTPLIEVTQPAQLDELVEVLRKCSEFAVDLEHHSYRSFMGITCLMQISTRDTDYIIDTLSLRDSLWVLNEVFTKPTILKIFHGADMDIQWLQRDLSLYVVNMFDTHRAAKQLELSGLSLAYLMQRYCNFVPNKQFQLADWRIRPLPDELKKYAREDTHYLLYIYQMLKNELLDRANGGTNLVVSVFKKCTEICKKRYFKPVLREDTYMDFYRKCKRLFDNRQLYALNELYKWRDQLARAEDESTGYVLPNHMLLQISETLPREMQGVLACCNPIPPLVRSNLLELHQIILRARDQPLEKPIFKEDTRARGTTNKISKINVDSPLHCPHDLTKTSDFRDDLPTILGNSISSSFSKLFTNTLENESTSPIMSVFYTCDNLNDEEQENKIKEKLDGFKFLGPFSRYKLVRPYIQEEENRLAKESSERLNTENADTDKRTDEDRIESIREHFLSLSRKDPPTVESVEPDRSLIQMGGIKRKRKPSPSVREEPLSVNLVCLPISNENSYNGSESRKRKSNDNADDASSPAKTTRKKPQKQQKKELRQKKDKKKKEQQNEEKSEDDSVDQQSGGKEVTPSKRQRNKGDQFTPYDYSSVDFRQFQGGAGSISKPEEGKSNIRFKNRKSNAKRGNKSATLGKGPANKGRRSGR